MIALTLSFKRLICRVLIGVFVSAQFAIAAYACPGLSEAIAAGNGEPQSMSSAAANASAGAMDAHASMDGSDGYAAIDPTLPHLCMGHCQFGNQSADHTPALSVAPALLTAIYTLPPVEEGPVLGVGRPGLLPDGRPGAGDPPHAILHCCFRD